jgi:hypothetical protein
VDRNVCSAHVHIHGVDEVADVTEADAGAIRVLTTGETVVRARTLPLLDGHGDRLATRRLGDLPLEGERGGKDREGEQESGAHLEEESQRKERPAQKQKSERRGKGERQKGRPEKADARDKEAVVNRSPPCAF